MVQSMENIVQRGWCYCVCVCVCMLSCGCGKGSLARARRYRKRGGFHGELDYQADKHLGRNSFYCFFKINHDFRDLKKGVFHIFLVFPGVSS